MTQSHFQTFGTVVDTQTLFVQLGKLCMSFMCQGGVKSACCRYRDTITSFTHLMNLLINPGIYIICKSNNSNGV